MHTGKGTFDHREIVAVHKVLYLLLSVFFILIEFALGCFHRLI